MSRNELNIAISALVVVLTVVSFALVMTGATDEPYMEYQHGDLLGQVVVATAVLTLWGCFAVAIPALVLGRFVSAKWLFVLVWVAMCVFYLSECPLGYISDLEQFILQVKS